MADAALRCVALRARQVWATPSCVLAYYWKDANFDWRATWHKLLSREYWLFLLPSSLLSVWLVWLPAVSIIYALPSTLQIPLFCIVCCFWSCLLQLIAKANTDDNTGHGDTDTDTTHARIDSTTATAEGREESEESAVSDERQAVGRRAGESMSSQHKQQYGDGLESRRVRLGGAEEDEDEEDEDEEDEQIEEQLHSQLGTEEVI